MTNVHAKTNSLFKHIKNEDKVRSGPKSILIWTAGDA